MSIKEKTYSGKMESIESHILASSLSTYKTVHILTEIQLEANL
jgi:hypothetical protein